MDYMLSEERTKRRCLSWIELVLALGALAGVVAMVVR
jgi:hypothetical protein